MKYTTYVGFFLKKRSRTGSAGLYSIYRRDIKNRLRSAALVFKWVMSERDTDAGGTPGGSPSVGLRCCCAVLQWANSLRWVG